MEKSIKSRDHRWHHLNKHTHIRWMSLPHENPQWTIKIQHKIRFSVHSTHTYRFSVKSNSIQSVNRNCVSGIKTSNNNEKMREISFIRSLHCIRVDAPIQICAKYLRFRHTFWKQKVDPLAFLFVFFYYSVEAVSYIDPSKEPAAFFFVFHSSVYFADSFALFIFHISTVSNGLSNKKLEPDW